MREVYRLSGFHQVLVFASTLQAQQCKNYGSLWASTLFCKAGMNLYYTIELHVVPPEATNELVVQTWTGSGQSYFWKIALSLFFTEVVFPRNQNQRLLLCSSFPQNQSPELPSSRLASSRQSWGRQFLVTPLQTANKNAPTLSLGNYWRIIYGQQK